jgi:NAD(P)H-dependent FMN reductase
MPNLHTVIVSTRPVRVGLGVGTWFHEVATRHGRFTTRLVDLKEVNLPFLDETEHPRLGKYEHQHTRDWSATVDAADAFVFVTPEYNFGAPAPFKNALDFLFREWAYKPAGFVGYGGISGGARSVQMAKGIVAGLRMMPIPEGVPIPFVAKQMEGGAFKATPANEKAAIAMLDELLRWTEAMRPLRAPSS